MTTISNVSADTGAFEASLKEQGYETVVLKEQPSNYFLGAHVHPFDARALITKGHITLTVGNVATRYDVGTVFELPAGTEHLEEAGSEGVTYLAGRRTPSET